MRRHGAVVGWALVMLGVAGCGAENGRDLAGVQVAPIIHCTRNAQSATSVTVGDITVDCSKRPEVVPPVVVPPTS